MGTDGVILFLMAAKSAVVRAPVAIVTLNASNLGPWNWPAPDRTMAGGTNQGSIDAWPHACGLERIPNEWNIPGIGEIVDAFLRSDRRST